MSKKFKTQASSGRAAGGFGAFSSSAFTSGYSSTLSYIQEAPDYSGVNNANAVVAFKNLSKKDGTTKAKALEDLSTYVSLEGNEIEESVLEAWVRQLAQSVNAEILSKCGKRTVKHLARIAGPLLASGYDNDRVVAKAAQEGITTIFPTPEKVMGLKKAFHASIVEYCKDALLHESIKTLSDERSVTADDAEATYARVLASSLTVMADLLNSLSPDEISKQIHIYEEILDSQQTWTFVIYSDASVRRAMHHLVQRVLKILPALIYSQMNAVSTAYIYKGLASDQNGSALGYVQAVNSLTRSAPHIWTSSYSGKKSAASRLQHLLKNGSQSGTSDYWILLVELLRIIPQEIMPDSYEQAHELLAAAREGVTKRDERLNALAAWSAYYILTGMLYLHLSDGDGERLLETCVLPILSQYLQPSPDFSGWSIAGAKAAMIVSQAAAIEKMTPLLERVWPDFAGKLVETVKMSQPLQSKDFEKSQLYVASCGERWANLHKELLASPATLASLRTTLITTNTRILDECVGLLRLREGKPFGAAAIIEEILQKCALFLLSDSAISSSLREFMVHDVPTLIERTPSRRQLTKSLLIIKDEPYFASAYSETLQRVTKSDQSHEMITTAIRDLLPSDAFPQAIDIARAETSFQTFVSNLKHPEDSTLFSTFLNLGVLKPETVDDMLSQLTASISISSSSNDALTALDVITRTSQPAVQAFMARSGTMGEQLLPNVINLEKSTNEDVANRASTLASRLSSAIGDSSNGSKFTVVLRGLQSIGPQAPPIDTLQDLTVRLLGIEEGSKKHVGDPSDIVPSLELWTAALVAAAELPCPSLALLSPLGGGVNLVRARSHRQESNPVQLDRDGLSQAMRISMYLSCLLCETDLLQAMEPQKEKKYTLIVLLHLTVLLAEDNLSVIGVNNLWHPLANQELEMSVLDFLTEANTTLSAVWQDMTPSSSSGIDEPSAYSRFTGELDRLGREYGEYPAMSYYHDLALAKFNANVFELHGHNSQSTRSAEALLKHSQTNSRVQSILTCIVGFQLPLNGAPALTRYCNELIADLTGMDAVDIQKAAKGFEQLVLLNAIIQTQNEVFGEIAKQRLVFLVKHLLSILTSEAGIKMAAEICKSLSVLLLGMHDMYGEHWSQTLSYLTSSWSLAEKVPEGSPVDEQKTLLVHATLKLYGTVQRLLKAAEPNDDLIDAQKEAKEYVHSSLVHLLKSRDGITDDNHQPLQVTHRLLGRHIAQLPYKPVKDPTELYQLLYAPSHAIQQAAFDLLHQEIPAVQEKISFDAALDNKSARLPDELLSLLLGAPTLDSLASESFQKVMPRQLRGYLFSWRLLFDHFVGSSYRVKNDYIEQLKDGAYLSGLLSLTFDFLGHTRGRPVDASKFSIRDYTPDTETTPEKDVQWLLIHLYYLALKNLPSSVKSYYLDIRSRPISQAVETWTAKHISPTIVNASLEGVAEWSEKSVKDDPEYERMSVKVGMKSKEITVSYVVDEQTMAIKVVLPEAYPLVAAEVLGINRVAVKEEQWQGWLRNCRGVIMFSVSQIRSCLLTRLLIWSIQNGSITDGLSVWQKNVAGALKGQTECAICYSIINSDKQLPTKRCPTCKHLFHGGCLHKWFKTSNASTCPLCRNPFSFN
nr:e3 ubiquitin-protein ligase listerin [Quercus suber]